ncbi:MAG: TonB-dependent receptor [Candidatus Marinimicrobia bacterium]|nr:TonB-dependent receptor [Candidatus Neomarinimicrobiota bacterium]
MKKRFFHFCILFLLLISVAAAQEIRGKVIGHLDKKPIPEALIVLEDPNDDTFQRETMSDQDGYFMFRDIPPGRYKLAALKEGYYSNSLFDFNVLPEQSYDVTIRLITQEGQWNAEYCFMIGGIEVRAVEKDVIQSELVTTRRIDSGEIDHLQADNLGDILTLVPGVEKSKQIGLASDQSIGIRKVANSNASLIGNETFGTTIMVDGNIINNDAMITGITSSLASGIDLRTIPADDIQSVEVITGIPSVEYGNFADGVIKVETKKGQIRSRAKAKFNPDTKGASFSSGLEVPFGGTLDYHLNYAYSERDIRKKGDEYHRFYLSSAYSGNAFDKKLDYVLKGSYTRALDDEEPTDANKIGRHSRDYRTSGGVQLKYKQNSEVTYSNNFNVDMNRKDNYRSRWVNDQIDTVYGYIGELREDGREWDIDYKLIRNKTAKKKNGNQIKTLYGVEFNYQKNTGEGVQIDSVFNYYGAYSTRRSYSFDQYPGFPKLSIYGERQQTWDVKGHSVEMMAGLRYDAINIRGFDIEPGFDKFSILNARQGEFLSPRFNTRIELTDGLYWRLGAGRSVKSISLAHIYRQSAFVKTFIDSQWVEIEYPQQNPDLKSYYSDKIETSLDWKANDWLGMSLTGYYSESKKQPTTITYPVGYDINPDTLTDLTYTRMENAGWSKDSGVELLMNTKRIKNLKFVLSATYRYSRNGREGRYYDSSPDTSWEEVWVPSPDTWKQKIILTQQTSYINQRLGLWLTMDIQYIPLDQKQTVYKSNSIETVLEDHPITLYQGMTYWYEAERWTYGDHWVVNARLSKSLGQNTEISLYVNNLFDDPGKWVDPYRETIYELNVPIYYGLEVSTQW